MRKIYYALFLLLYAVWGQLYAQCPANGPTVYSITGSSTLQSVDPATGVATTINTSNGAGTNTSLVQNGTYYTPQIGGVASAQLDALAWDVSKGKLWYATNYQSPGNVVYIFSYDIASNKVDKTWAQFKDAAGTTVVNPIYINKAAYNPADGMIYFHASVPLGQAQLGIYRLNPSNPAAGAVYLGALSIDGATESGSSTMARGGDIAFDALGNMTGVFNTANKVVVFKAQYDANGNYLGFNRSGQSLLGYGNGTDAVAYLSDGNYIVGNGSASSGTFNTNTGAYTAYPGSGINSSVDYASCTAPAPNISSVQKTATRNCAARTITYTITVANTGNGHAYDAVLKDATPAGLTLTGGTLNGITLVNPAALNGSGLPLRSPGSIIDGLLMKGTTATIVLNYSYAASGDGATFSNQGFVSYLGVQALNLPNDQIPTDDPATAAAGDATSITQCTSNPPANCPNEIYAVGATTGNSTGAMTELFVLDPTTFSVVRTYPLPYTPTNNIGTYSIAVPNTGFAYTVSWRTLIQSGRIIYKTDLTAAPNAAASTSTGIVLPPITDGSANPYYISGTADKDGNIYFSSDHGTALIKVDPVTGTITTLWNSANPLTLAPGSQAPPAGVTFTSDFKDLTIDANGDYYFIDDNAKRLWQVLKGTTTVIYRGVVNIPANNTASDIIFVNGIPYIVTSGPTATPGSGPTRIFKLDLATMTTTEVVRPAGQNQVFADAASPVCSLMSLAPLNGKVLNDNNGQTGGVNGNPVAGATVTLYAANGTTVIATTTTDADGNYHFNNIAPNTTYVVGVTPPAGFSNVSSSDGVTPTDGKTTITTPVSGTLPTSVDFGVNQPPVATNDGLTGQAIHTPATVPNILANDTDPNGGVLEPNNISLIAPAGATGITTAPDGDVTGFTIPGQGTWALNPATGDVTFTPQAGFVGDPTPITYTVRDAAGLTSPPATITIDYVQVPPVATNDSSTGNPAGSTVTQNILANDTLSNGQLATPTTTTVTLTNTGLPSGSTVSGNTVTVPGQGTWTYNPTTGALSFAPNAGFTGNPTPLTYTLTETATGLSDNATVTVGYVQRPPVATNDSSTGNPVGSTVTQNILSNDTLSNGQLATPTTTTVTLTNTGLPTGSTVSGNTVTVPGQGVWTYNPTTGALSFAPNAGFTGNPTPLTYTLTETATGLSDNATVTVGYVQRPPVATNDSSTGNPAGSTVTQNILANDTLSNGQLATPTTVTVTLTNTGLPSGSTVSGNTVTVPGQGTWTYNPTTGALSFAPNAGFTGNPTPLTYTLTETATGLSDNATVTVGYVQQPPVATNDSSTGNPAGSTVTQNILANDTLSTGGLATPANSTVTLTNTGLPTGSTVSGNTVTVPGQGVWTYNPTTGALSFAPNAGFTGNPTPLTYTLTETATGLSDNATVTVGYVQQPPVATNDSSTGNPAGSTVTQNILSNDTLSNGQLATPTTVTVTLTNTGLPSGSTVSGNTVTVPGQGTWTYNPTTGALSFAPNAGFTGNPTPLTYTLTETATGLSDNATVTVGYVQQPPVATNDSSTGNPAGSTVTQNILSNDTLSNGQLATPTTVTVTLTNTGLPSGSTVSGNTVTVPGQGTWTYNPTTGALSFAPNAGFTGNPTPLTYTLTETATGLSDNATVTVGYVQQPPVATNDTDTYISGSPKTVNVLANDTTGSTPVPATVVITTTGVSGDGKSLTVAGEGTWTVNPTTGAITFTPQTGFTGNPTPISYTVRDAQGNVSNTATVTLTTGGLPVTLISFTARPVNGKAVLTWHTSKEVNFDRFVVQKFDPVTEQYTAFREIQGGKSFYTTTDDAITREDNYYRLKMIDKDGTFEYSKVVSVEVPQPVRPLRVYPNPVTNRQFHISRETALESIRLVDMTGREVPVRVTELPDAYQVNISSAAPGAYLLVYQTKGVRFQKSLVIH